MSKTPAPSPRNSTLPASLWESSGEPDLCKGHFTGGSSGSAREDPSCLPGQSHVEGEGQHMPARDPPRQRECSEPEIYSHMHARTLSPSLRDFTLQQREASRCARLKKPKPFSCSLLGYGHQAQQPTSAHPSPAHSSHTLTGRGGVPQGRPVELSRAQSRKRRGETARAARGTRGTPWTQGF